MTDSLPADPRARSWNLALLASPGALDLDVPADRVDGVVPAHLRGGRLLSNGPGWNHIGGWTAHPFDGHGYVRAFRFREDGGLSLRARFVETPSYVAEARAGRLVHRGFATNLPGGPLVNLGFGPQRNVANTTITRWGDQLLAGWEAGAPYGLDPESLATRGEATFGETLAGQATLAHFHKDVGGGRMIACSLANPRQPRLTFRELDAGGAVVATRQATLPGPTFLHDFAFTDRWYVVAGNPLGILPLRMLKMLAGMGTLLGAVEPDARQAPVLYLIPRRDDGPVRVVRLPGPTFVVHFANAFERDGDVVVDTCAFPAFEFGEEFGYSGPQAPFDPGLPDARGPQRFLRVTVPAGATEATWRHLAPHGVDFPRVHPAHEGTDTPAVYGATRADPRFSDPFDSVIRVDARDPERPPELWTVPANQFVGEPVFVPEPGSDVAGHVLAIVSDGLADTTRLVVLDALDLAAGPVATVPLPLLPVAFHGDWDGPA